MTAWRVGCGEKIKFWEDRWSGKEVKLSHLRIFCCVSYILIDSNSRDKLNLKARKCYFIGYESDMYCYRFLDDQNKKVIKRRNVTFNENLFYKDKFFCRICMYR